MALPKFNENLRIKVGAGFIPARDSNPGGLRAGVQFKPAWIPACAHARQLKKKTVVLDSGSGFPAAISLAGM
ncbi:MAG: hypothetical protein JRD84_00150 [Deltaproteobacteria bacterium]|nr:hypothetical protein [Deltaproteobacteria bacterium]